MMLDVEEDSFDVDVEAQHPERIDKLLAALKASKEAQASEAEAQRKLIGQLRDYGLPLRDVGNLVGVSHQRVSKILKEAS